MTDWTSGTADASVAQRLSAFIPLRVPGSPDVFMETPTTDFMQKDANGEINNTGIVRGGNQDVTSGGIWAAPRYVAGQMPQVLGGMYSSAKILIGHGVKSSTTTADTFISSIDNASWARGALVIGDDLRFFNAAAQATAIGSVVSMTERLKVDTSGHILPGTDNAQDLGSGPKRLRTLYAGTGAINTSDERQKCDIGDIPEAWLDAWTDVEWRRFKFMDGVRWHIGLIAQQVHAAFAAHGIDAFEIGLCCFDEWQDQFEPVMREVVIDAETGEIEFQPTGEMRQVQEAGDRWGLRYDECQAMEAAWQRRKIAALEARLAALEAAA